jgi:hypothetical protein
MCTIARMRNRLIGLSLAAASLAACTQSPAARPVPPPPAPPPAPAAAPVPAAVHAFMGAMLDDAAQRSGVPRAQLRVKSAQAVVWSDGSMGCPQPGRMYTQALVPGWLIEVDAPGAAPLRYHASQRGAWLHCPASRAQAPLQNTDEVTK